MIPVFNRLELTKKCVASIKSQSVRNEIIIVVVDDGSTDGTSAWLSGAHPDVVILQGTGKLFWGGAVHFGIEYVKKNCLRGDFLVLVNNDVVIQYNAIEYLRAFIIENNLNVIAGAVAVDRSDQSTILKSGTKVKNWLFNITAHPFAGEIVSKLNRNRAIEVDFLTARCLMHPIEVFWVAGNYNHNMFRHYCCDDEFSMRVKNFGFRTFLVSSSIVYLETGESREMGFIDTLFSLRSSSNIFNKYKLSLAVAPIGCRVGFFLGGLCKSVVVAIKNVAQHNLMKFRGSR